MRPLTLAVVASVALLAGCSEQRSGPNPGAPSAPTAPSTSAATAAVQPPVDLLGTWTDRSGGGFLAIGARQIVIAVDGAPRSVASLSENAIEPGMAAGRLGLADGTALYLARGSTLVDGIPIDHLDVEIIQAGSAGVRRRLLSENGLRLAARLARPVITAPPTQTPDSIFIAAVPDGRRSEAEHLVARASTGAARSEVAAAFAEHQRNAYAAMLLMLDQAGTLPPAEARRRLQQADLRRAEAERFAQAWQAWMAGRG